MDGRDRYQFRPSTRNIAQIVQQYCINIAQLNIIKLIMSSAPLQPVNYLTELKRPSATREQMYQNNKEMKTEFSYVKGAESHLLRRKMILRDHPEIARLLIVDKPWTILIMVPVILLGLCLIYYGKDLSWTPFLLLSYLALGTVNHTCHCLIHDFTHLGGHSSILVNKVCAVLCNIPMGIPSALSFGKYHADHHNFLGEEYGDPDLPLRWEALQSVRHVWYKYVFYSLIEVFYACRPFFMTKSFMNLEEFLNLAFILLTNFLIFHFWGANALLFTLIGGAFSIGPHPAAIHIIAEHYEFVGGQQTYDYIGFWNVLNIDLGYHLEHHDFPSCPWYNLRKIRAIAPEYYEYLPYHTSYTSVIKKFLCDLNWSLFARTIRIPEGVRKNE